MHSAGRVSPEQKLAAMARRMEQLRGELSAQAEAIAAGTERGKPARARVLARFDRMRERCWSIQRRYEALRARGPAAPVVDEDF